MMYKFSLMNIREFLNSHRDPNTALLLSVVVPAVAAVIYYAPGLLDDENNSESQADPQPGVGRLHPDYHPLPSYESGKGPDGENDFRAIRITPQGRDSYHIDGGTPAPPSEHPNQPSR